MKTHRLCAGILLIACCGAGSSHSMDGGEISPESLYVLFSRSGKSIPNLTCATIVESQRNYSNGVFTVFDGRYRFDRSLSKKSPEERNSTLTFDGENLYALYPNGHLVLASSTRAFPTYYASFVNYQPLYMHCKFLSASLDLPTPTPDDLKKFWSSLLEKNHLSAKISEENGKRILLVQSAPRNRSADRMDSRFLVQNDGVLTFLGSDGTMDGVPYKVVVSEFTELQTGSGGVFRFPKSVACTWYEKDGSVSPYSFSMRTSSIRLLSEAPPRSFFAIRANAVRAVDDADVGIAHDVPQ